MARNLQSSIFISSAGTALLTDIGIAAIPQPPDWGFHGIDGARWLAPELMDTALRPTPAPDAVNAMRTPDVKLPMTLESDVYAFGMLSYEVPFLSSLSMMNTRPNREHRCSPATFLSPPRTGPRR